MKTLRILVAAFLGGVILAACGRTITAPAETACQRFDLAVLNAVGDTVAFNTFEVC